MSHVRKGDTVVVLTGKDKGKTGEVLKVFPKANRVVVDKVNIIKRHTKATQKSQGGIVERSAAFHSSNVKVISKSTGAPKRDAGAETPKRKKTATKTKKAA